MPGPCDSGSGSDGDGGLAAATGRMGRPELAPVWERLSARWSEAGERPVRRLSLRGFDDTTRNAAADLLGLDRLPGEHQTIGVDQLAAALHLGAEQLRRAVEALTGPLPDRAGDRRSVREARAELWAWLEAACARQGRSAWFPQVQRAGIPNGDAAAHRALLADVLRVLDRLPLDEPLPLARLASDALGHPHGLDPGTRTARLVLDALAAGMEQPPPVSAEQTRQLWAQVGVVADELSPIALVHGLAVRPDHPLGGLVSASAELGEPVAITLSQARRWPLALVAPGLVRVVENPSVLAAAAARAQAGGGPAPLVCLSGWPNLAVLTVLRQLAGSGARLAVHADFDPNGLRIVEMVQRRIGAEPWLMGAVDYRRHAAVATTELSRRAAVPTTPWDPALQAAMAEHRRAVYEEQLIDELLPS